MGRFLQLEQLGGGWRLRAAVRREAGSIERETERGIQREEYALSVWMYSPASLTGRVCLCMTERDQGDRRTRGHYSTGLDVFGITGEEHTHKEVGLYFGGQVVFPFFCCGGIWVHHYLNRVCSEEAGFSYPCCRFVSA